MEERLLAHKITDEYESMIETIDESLGKLEGHLEMLERNYKLLENTKGYESSKSQVEEYIEDSKTSIAAIVKLRDTIVSEKKRLERDNVAIEEILSSYERVKKANTTARLETITSSHKERK